MSQKRNIRESLKTNSVLFDEIFKQLEGLHLHHLKSKTLFEITGYVNSVKDGSYLELYNPKATSSEFEFEYVLLNSPKIENVLKDLENLGLIPAVVFKEQEDIEDDETYSYDEDCGCPADCPICAAEKRQQEEEVEGLSEIMELLSILVRGK